MAPTDRAEAKPEQTHIRRATPQDAMACASIVHSWLDKTPFISTPPPAAAIEDALRSGIPNYHVWVIGDPVAAYLSFCPKERLIRGFYTANPGSGLGKKLLDHVKSGQTYLSLWTHAPNTRAHRFYQREGFTFSGETRPGDDGPEELQMVWSHDTAR